MIGSIEHLIDLFMFLRWMLVLLSHFSVFPFSRFLEEHPNRTTASDYVLGSYPKT